jgi:hypothetical protein
MNFRIFQCTVVLLIGLFLPSQFQPTATADTAVEINRLKPVRVFILAGQSNMEGAGVVSSRHNPRNMGKGTLEYLVNSDDTKERYKHTVDSKGDWIVRNDVFIWYLDRKGGLSVGYGAKTDRIGPEFQFGHFLGEAFDEPVLLIKVAWGGKSLAKDFRPPSSGGEVGVFYKQMLNHVESVLKNIPTDFPQLSNRKYILSGFGWHQGWNDGCNQEQTSEYESNLVNFIKDVRKDLNAPDLPFVIANSGFAGWDQKVDRRLEIMKAQAAAANKVEFRGTVKCVETRDFYRAEDVSPSRQRYHWNGNAETYFLIGEAMGQSMFQLVNQAD